MWLQIHPLPGMGPKNMDLLIWPTSYKASLHSISYTHPFADVWEKPFWLQNDLRRGLVGLVAEGPFDRSCQLGSI